RLRQISPVEQDLVDHLDDPAACDGSGEGPGDPGRDGDAEVDADGRLVLPGRFVIGALVGIGGHEACRDARRTGGVFGDRPGSGRAGRAWTAALGGWAG